MDLDQLALYFNKPTATAADVCDECNIPMENSEDNTGFVVCPLCGVMRVCDPTADITEQGNAKVRMKTGGVSRVYNMSQENSQSQLSALIAEFTARHREYKGPGIPAMITARVARTYNDLQKQTAAGVISASYRGNVKGQILAAMIYFTCLRNGISRTKKEVKAFMGLEHNSGISQGEGIVRKLHSHGVIDVVADESAAAMAARFLEALGIVGGAEFIADCVETADKYFLCTACQLASKVDGALWIYIRFSRLRISDDEIEAKVTTRKTTFMKFAHAVLSREYFPLFLPVFERHGVNFI